VRNIICENTDGEFTLQKCELSVERFLLFSSVSCSSRASQHPLMITAQPRFIHWKEGVKSTVFRIQIVSDGNTAAKQDAGEHAQITRYVSYKKLRRRYREAVSRPRAMQTAVSGKSSAA